MRNTHQETKNNRGFMHPLSELSLSFIDYAAKIKDPVLDLGCAYGIASIEAIKAGATNVIACDMEAKHLEYLKQEALNLNQLARHLTLKLGRFPDEIDFGENSLGAILTSYMLSFLTPNELEIGLNKIFTWLKPGGKIFIALYTIFIDKFCDELFMKEYTRRVNLGQKWPGYFENFKQFALPSPSNAGLPQRVHYFEIAPLVTELTNIGFTIDMAKYLDGRLNGAVLDSINDGREILGIIATKP